MAGGEVVDDDVVEIEAAEVVTDKVVVAEFLPAVSVAGSLA